MNNIKIFYFYIHYCYLWLVYTVYTIHYKNCQILIYAILYTIENFFMHYCNWHFLLVLLHLITLVWSITSNDFLVTLNFDNFCIYLLVIDKCIPCTWLLDFVSVFSWGFFVSFFLFFFVRGSVRHNFPIVLSNRFL